MNKIMFNVPKEYENLSGIYIITNSVNDQVYIGRTKHFFNRYKQHLTNINNNRENHKFKTLMIYYPEIVFTYSLLELTNDIIEREKYYIKQYDSVNNGLNIVYSDEDFLQLIGSFQKLDSYKQYKMSCKQFNSKKISKHSGSESISQFIQSLGKKRTAKDKRYRVWFS